LSILSFNEQIRLGIPNKLPEMPEFEDSIDRAPFRPEVLSSNEKLLAIENALRYFPKKWHTKLSKEFYAELVNEGHITMHRFRPNYSMYARPINEYPSECVAAAGVMLMIQNNLDPRVAQYPYDLITYGGNGAVFQNWAQYLLTMSYLSKMSEKQTLVMYSGHPLGLFPSTLEAPRVVVTNGMVIPNYSTQNDYEVFNALGVSQYGQMTAGSYMYIGPQGIVHGTTITILNAARKYLGKNDDDGLGGVLFVTSGLGGMSGAQAKAAVISGAVCVIAETNKIAVEKRLEQGWLSEYHYDVNNVIESAKRAISTKKAISIGYIGNIVDLLVALDEYELTPELGSDQTSLHNPWLGGYIPTNYSHAEALQLLKDNPSKFKSEVERTLREHSSVVNRLSEKGMHFWDYGNAFLLEARKAGGDVINPNEPSKFRYPSYVEDIMGPICFDFGFGPFRWVCTSCDGNDLKKTDEIAIEILQLQAENANSDIKQQILDNIRWIKDADKHQLVVGSKARILYADEKGRKDIASAFNTAIKNGTITAPIVLGRDHHDVSGTDSPFRETANIHDGSMFTADMSVHNFVGDAFRGATWVSLHNGGGVGWGEVSNGGFGMLIDGSARSQNNIDSMLSWDVNNGIARRAWARNPGSISTIIRAMDSDSNLLVTIPNLVDSEILQNL
jgi:urocanate hydratase